MNTPIRRLALVAMLCTVACVTQEDSTQTLDTQERALGTSQANAPLLVLDSGHYSRYVYRGATSESFWVDLSVRNDAFQKEVGVVWSSDGFQTSQTTLASYELGLPGGRERWGIDVKDFAGIWGGQSVEVEYAAYVKMNGQTYWSAFRNHYIYHGVSQNAPVRLLTSKVSLDASGHPVLSGAVRALNVQSERKVFVRFTTDAWQSFSESEASFDGKDFAFSTALPFSAESTEEVEFAARFEAEGEAHWDNNGGANYRHRLAPSFVALSFQDDGVAPASGLRVLSGSAVTDLPVAAVSVRIDGGPAFALLEFPSVSYEQVNGFSSWGSISYAFPVAGLSDGVHSLVVDVTAGPFVRTSQTLSFNVDNRIASASTWDLSVGETPWDLEVTSDGRAYVMRESEVHVYEALGAAEPERVLTSSGPGRLLDMTVGPDGRVFTLSDGTVSRFLATGELDAAFGSAGTLALDASYAGRTLCYAANLEAMQSYLYVIDSCNSRVLRFSFDGVFEAEVDLSSSLVYTNVTRTFDDGERLWVGVDLYADGVLQHQLVAISDVANEAPSVVTAIELSASVQNLDAFALIPTGGLWATTGWQELYRVDAAGEVDALWTGGGRLLTQAGAISIGRAVSVLADGSVAVLSVDTAKVERFVLTP